MLSQRKEKKIKIQLHLHYPNSYTKLTTDQLKNIATISSDVETDLSGTIAFSPLLPGSQGSSIQLGSIETFCSL